MNLRWWIGVRDSARFGMLHVEHGALCAALLVFALFVVKAVRRETLPWTPADLARAVDVAQTRLRATPAPRIPVVRYSRVAQESVRPVSEASYALFAPFDPPKWQTRKRSMPEVYPVRDLVISAGRGALAAAIGDTAGSHDARGTRGERWICLTGLIEHGKQAEAFRNALWQSPFHDPRRDLPDYVYFRVERAEVDPRQPEAAPAWVRQDVRRMYLRRDSWPHDGSEPVDPRRLPPERSGIRLAFPLGPLEDRPWGPEVCHPRLAPQSTASPSRAKTAGHARTGGDIRVRPDSTDDPEFLLFRYFDYDVKPEKRYRYRVRLILANPNYAALPHRLESERWAADRYLETEWSEPSAAVTIADDTQVLAGPARTAGAKAMVLLTKFLMATGETVYEEFQVRPGQVLDFPGRMLPAPVESSGVVNTPAATPAMSTQPRPSPRQEDRFRRATTAPARELPPGARTVDYSSGVLLLDVRGGHPLPGRGRLTEPAGLLLIDPQGNLVVRYELDERSEDRLPRQLATPSEGVYAGTNAGPRKGSKGSVLE